MAAMSALLFSSAVSFAQMTDAKLRTKKELLQRIMKEKFHPEHEEAEEHNAGVRAKTTGYDQRISSSSSTVGEGEVSMAYNPNDSSELVLSYMQQTASGSLTFPIYYSSNGGSSWTQASFSSASICNADFPGQFAAGGGDPAFAWDKNGRLYYAWIYLTVNPSFDTGFFTLNWAYSDDKGHTWNVKPKHFIGRGAIDLASNATLPMYDGITDREWLAVDNSGGAHQGNVYCSFVCFPAGTASAYEGIKTLVPGTDTFGNAVPAYMGNTQFGNVEVDKNGILHMSFADIDNSQIRHVASTDGGATFGTSVVVSGASVIFPAGPSYAFHNRENAAVNMAVDGRSGSGSNVHIVWSDFPGTSAVSYYSHSTNGGLTWSVPDTINKYFGNNMTVMPTVAAEGNNVTVSVTAINGADSSWYYQLNSTDNGASFGSLSTTSALPTKFVGIGANNDSSPLFFGDYNRSVRALCQTYATWSDGRTTTAKVYFARKNFCRLGVQELTTVNSGVQLTSVFPNPASGQVNLEINANVAQPVTVQLYDMTGKKVAEQRNVLKAGLQQITLPLQGIAKGVYLISLQSNTGIIATRNVEVN